MKYKLLSLKDNLTLIERETNLLSLKNLDFPIKVKAIKGTGLRNEPIVELPNKKRVHLCFYKYKKI